MLQGLIIFGVGWLVFGVDWGDPPAALLLIVTFALVGTGVGMLLGLAVVFQMPAMVFLAESFLKLGVVQIKLEAFILFEITGPGAAMVNDRHRDRERKENE